MLFENEYLNISQIYNVLYYKPKSLHHKYPHKPAFYELTYYIKGDSIITFNGQTIHMTAGDVLYIPKTMKDINYTVDASEEFSLYNIYFDTDAELPDEAIKITAKPEEFKAYFEKIYRIWLEKRTGYYYKAMQQAYNILDLLLHTQLRYTPNDKLNYLLLSDEYIAEHYCDMKFDYETMISQSGLSYSYFKKLFIDKYGCPPVKYITKLKINRACELLQTKKFSVSEIAHMCGFENVYYFSNVFKKQMGISPKNYI